MGRRAPAFAEIEHEYLSLWQSMEVKASALPAISATARRIIAARERYQAIETATGVPWFVVGAIHAMEAGLRFDRHLHNGDPLAACTVQVPAGRPAKGRAPFTWEESACDALLMKGLDTIERWDVARICFELERYNGWGYRLYHPDVATPYLWSGTTHYTRGKYVADGRWSATAVSGQSGAMAIVKRLSELDTSIVLDAAAADPATEFVRTPDAAASAPRSMAQSSTGNTALGIGGGASSLAGVEVSSAATRLAQSGEPVTFGSFVLALLQSPTFLVSACIAIGSAYIWLERRRKLVAHGI